MMQTGKSSKRRSPPLPSTSTQLLAATWIVLAMLLVYAMWFNRGLQAATSNRKALLISTVSIKGTEPVGSNADASSAAAEAAVPATPQPLQALPAADLGPPPDPIPRVPEIWARGPANQSAAAVAAVRSQLGAQTIQQLQQLCGRGLYMTLSRFVKVQQMGRYAIVLTGDIPAVWLRDSAVQMASYFPRVQRRPAIRNVLEGALRAQAFFLLQDPWANAYNPAWVKVQGLPKQDRQLGRGGWVWTRNFELDSLAYFLMYLWNWWACPDIWRPEDLLMEPQVRDAVVEVLRVLEIEQHHEERSPYRYSELPRDGLGPPTAYTGMVWSAFRASDDPQTYSYHIPDNMYLVGALKRLRVINAATWRDPYIGKTAARLIAEVSQGIEQHGIVTKDGVRVYAYEVDGLGNALTSFDDPNIPSLLAIPELGYDAYDKQVYAATMAQVFSTANRYYFEGSQLKGLGSPHTPAAYVWPLATAMEALVSNDAARQASLLKDLLLMAWGNGLVHESVMVDSPQSYTRPEFGWANALAAVAIEQLLGEDCDAAAEQLRIKGIGDREGKEPRTAPNGGRDHPAYYEQLEASIQYQ